MGQAIGQSLPHAVGVALSPVPIIVVVLLLATPQATVNGVLFVVGWLAGLLIIGGVVVALAGSLGAQEHGQPRTWVSWLELGIGLLLLLVAVRQFRHRPREGEEAHLPAMMGRIDQISPWTTGLVGAVLVAANPKNLLLTVSGATAIGQAGITSGQAAIALAVFAVIASLGVAAPVVLYVALGQRSEKVLGRLKDWMSQNNAVIMSVLCMVMGMKVIGDAITSLASS
jgi:cytochrome c biogenesis protein CcdA